MIGGSSLPELRAALLLAESERDGGVSPRVGPFVDVADMGRLLSSAGFALPTVDVDTLRFSFPNAMVLMEHIQRMGEANACVQRKKSRTSVDTFLATACLYEDMFPLSDQEVEGIHGEIEATVQVIYCIGWAPHDSQPKPKARGSATRRIGEPISGDKGLE
jgi:NADH dehydrogenase [ubiquinone] 1 alpha subcomplex assembly factor 5